jgi:CxxC motif-containing protein (DUF1111 family)
MLRSSRCAVVSDGRRVVLAAIEANEPVLALKITGAGQALASAQRKDPTNKYVQNNLRLLEESYRKGKSVE